MPHRYAESRKCGQMTIKQSEKPTIDYRAHAHMCRALFRARIRATFRARIRATQRESKRATATRMAGGTSGRARDERLPLAVRGIRVCPARSRLVPATPHSFRVCRAGGRDDGAAMATGCGGLLRSARGVGTMAGTGAGRRPALSSAGGRAPA